MLGEFSCSFTGAEEPEQSNSGLQSVTQPPICCSARTQLLLCIHAGLAQCGDAAVGSSQIHKQMRGVVVRAEVFLAEEKILMSLAGVFLKRGLL